MCALDICLQDDHLTNDATTCHFNLIALGETLCTLNCMDADRKNALLLAITCIVPAAWLSVLLGL